jgi:CubicO group peptidase (beta-lactamase class C family)
VDPLLPELADRQVLTAPDGPVDDTVPAQRPITLRDLLTFRSGYGMIMGSPDEYPIIAALNEKGLSFGPPNPAKALPQDEWLARLAEIPLIAQPGEKWLYNTGSDILGVLIARATGQPLEKFLNERIFTPLGMQDTAFSVKEANADRLPTSYLANPATGKLDLYDPAEGGGWTKPPLFPSGAGGLLSTLDDYSSFAKMLHNMGRHNNEQILTRPTVEAMTTDQLTEPQKKISGFYPGYFDNMGWGFGVAITTGKANPSSTPGQYGWDGGLGTSWWTDPKEDLTAIMMHQRAEFHPTSKPYLDFWTTIYQSIED